MARRSGTIGRPGGPGGRPGSTGVGAWRGKGHVGFWPELKRVFERHAVYADSTRIIVAELAGFLRRARLDRDTPDSATDHAVLDILTAIDWALVRKSPELKRLQRVAHTILETNDPRALAWNRAKYRSPSDLGRGLVSEIESYRRDLAAGMQHDVQAFGERIATWLVAANVRVRMLDAPTVESVRGALIAKRELRELDPREHVESIAALVLRTAGVPAKKAWNAVNAAEGMKESRKKKRAARSNTDVALGEGS